MMAAAVSFLAIDCPLILGQRSPRRPPRRSAGQDGHDVLEIRAVDLNGVATRKIRPFLEIPRQLELLRQMCEREGRDHDAIEKTAPFAFRVGADGSKVGELIEKLRWLAGMGIETLFGWVVAVDRITPIEIMGREVIPQVAGASLLDGLGVASARII
jgi:hypothetical protein